MPADRIYRRHLSALKYCAKGSREFFQKHGLSWSEFLREGIDRETLASLQDAMANKAIMVADAEDGR